MSDLRRFALWASVYAVLSAAIMLPTSLHPAHYKFGGQAISDSLDTIYRLWAETHATVEVADGDLRNPMVAAPEGVPVARPRQPVWWAARAASALGGPIFGYNAAVYASFLLSALLTHWLVRRATGSDAAAMVAALAFSWSPFHILQSGDHINLAQLWVFPLFFLALLHEIESRSWASALGLCAALALCFWIHGYYGLFLLIVSPVIFGWQLLRGQIVRDRAQLLRLGALAAGFVAIALVAAASLQTIDAAGGVSGLVERPLWHLESLGVRWYEWLLPPHYSVVFGEPVRSFLAQRMHGSNPAEMTLFLGFAALLLAAAFWWSRWRDGSAGEKPIDVLAQALVVAALVALLLSTTPSVDLFGASLPMPSRLLYPLFPMLRALSRWGVLVIFAVACFAGFGFAVWAKGRAPSRIWSGALATCAVMTVEYAPLHAGFHLDSTRVPAVYEAVRELPKDSLVLDLPVTALNDFLPYFWQMFHGKCLYNVPGADHEHSQQVLAFQASNLQGIVARARHLGIDAIVIHSEQPLGIGRGFPPVLARDAVVNPALPYSALLSVPSDAEAAEITRSSPCG